MRPSIRAVIFSGLLCPGLGYFVVRQRKLGWIVTGLSLLCVGYVTNAALDAANGVAQALQNGAIPLDAEAIASAAHDASEHGMDGAQWAVWVLTGLWAVSVCHGYLLGKRLEAEQAAGRDGK